MQWRRWFGQPVTLALVVGVFATTASVANCWAGNMNSIPSPTMITWLVDGNNLSCSRKVPNEREIILQELRKIASPYDGINCVDDVVSNVVVVFDGNEDECFPGDEELHGHHPAQITVERNLWFRWAVTDGTNRKKDRADDYIINCVIPDYLQTLCDANNKTQHASLHRVHLVSADKQLQKRVLKTRIMNGGSFVHPPQFWKDYLPVLQQKQIQKQQM